MVETQITELIYNQLSREQFNELVANNEVQEDEFYLVTGDDVTKGVDGTNGIDGVNGADGLTTSVTMNGSDASSGITNGLFGMMAGNGSVGMVDFEGIPVMFFGNAAASPEYLIVKVDGDPIDNGLCIADMASETVAPIATKDDLDILEESFEADLAETYTQAVDEAKDYTDEAISAIGADGLTTSITLNGETKTQENGNIDLGNLATPEFVSNAIAVAITGALEGSY